MELMTASNNWASRPADQRFETLTELRAALRMRTSTSRERDDIPASRIEPVVVGGPSTTYGRVALRDVDRGETLDLTHWSFGQLARAASSPADYLRSLPPALAVECLRTHLKDGQYSGLNDSAKLFVHDREAGPVLQALTSRTYGRIFDHQVADAVQAIVDQDSRWHNPLAYGRDGLPVPSGLYASDRDVFVFMIDGGSRLEHTGDRAELHRGFFAWNSEVGSKAFGLCQFLFNEVCGNHIIWGATDVRVLKIRHSLYAPDRFASEAGPMLLEYANASAAPIELAVRQAHDYLLPVQTKGGSELLDWFKGAGFSGSEARSAIASAEREEGECRTLWQAVQGLTAYARDLAFAEARVDLSTRAGKLLDRVAA